MVSLISFIPILTFAQHSEDILQKEIVSLVNENGDTIKVTGTIYENLYDTVFLIVEKIEKGEMTIIQEFKTLYSYPLEISQCPSSFGLGIFIKYDPAVKNGDKYLYLYSEKINKLKQVEGFEYLGFIKTINMDDKEYFYSYNSCGCADDCWESTMFKIKKFRIHTLGYITCNCENLFEKIGKAKESVTNNCDIFNTEKKFKNIHEYWVQKIKNGLFLHKT